MADYNKLFNEKMGELMQAVQFPKELVNEKFARQVHECLSFHTPTSLECSIDEYQRVYQSVILPDNRMWFMPQMFIAIFVVKSGTPKQHDISISDYVQLQKDLQIMSEKWDTIAAPYIEQAKKYVNEVSKRDQREAEAKGRIVTFNASGKA